MHQTRKQRWLKDVEKALPKKKAWVNWPATRVKRCICAYNVKTQGMGRKKVKLSNCFGYSGSARLVWRVPMRVKCVVLAIDTNDFGEKMWILVSHVDLSCILHVKVMMPSCKAHGADLCCCDCIIDLFCDDKRQDVSSTGKPLVGVGRIRHRVWMRRGIQLNFSVAVTAVACSGFRLSPRSLCLHSLRKCTVIA